MARYEPSTNGTWETVPLGALPMSPRPCTRAARSSPDVVGEPRALYAGRALIAVSTAP